MEEAFLKIVKTFDGSKAIKGNCKYIKGQYYEKNRHCFMMPNGKWNRVDNGLIALDNRTGSWKFISDPGMQKGVVGSKNGKLVIDYFTIIGNELTLIYKNDQYRLLDEKLVNSLNLVEDIGTGLLYSREEVNIPASTNYIGKKQIYNYNRMLNYDSKHELYENIKSFETFGIKGLLNFYPKELGDTTFGIEFETWNGTIKESILPKIGLIPLKDGSLRHNNKIAYEYATIPLKGSKGLYIVKRACDVLNKYTDISELCSTHLHLGGFKRSKELILALYLVQKAIDNEVYSMFPKWYMNTAQFKEKSYCGPLPNFLIKDKSTDEAFDKLYNFLSQGRDFQGFTNEEHPDDIDGNRKWQVRSRYYNLNFVPFLWGQNKTIEFRVHPPTKNPIKIINWIFICNAIVKFADLNKNSWKDIEKSLSLQQIFKFVYNPDLANYLINYVKHLKQLRISYDFVSDFSGLFWVKQDESFTFPDHNLLTQFFKDEPDIY